MAKKPALDEDGLAQFRGDRITTLRARAAKLLVLLDCAQKREAWGGFKAAVQAAERHADVLAEELTTLASQVREARSES